MNSSKILLGIVTVFSVLTIVAAQNTTHPPYYNGTGPPPGFHMGVFGLLTPILVGVIILLLAVVIVLAYLLMKEKRKNRGRAK